MNKVELAELLRRNHSKFTDLLDSLSETDFLYAPEGKWNAGEQLDHLVKSVAPVKMAFTLPKLILKLMFGTANRSSRTYEALIEKYNAKLKEGGRASGRFVAKQVPYSSKQDLIHKLTRLVDRLSKLTEKQNEDSLDKYILPHPLLGKLTLREMLYFTAYHVQHHEELVKLGLEKK